ncbi:TRAF3-interacting protein 1 isoform X4 [Thalassophryne amazonica]|uniref:TRAF3-interacting protein 1 isoform X4 n=1 Tax=Thalassophryne amazonica TaxID=390379 RepID=UPI001470BE9B|nr:TRAF3-interacting protein 1 isoform X4 [Thalassophryne amazonica]
MNATVVKKTQDTLGKVIKKPRLTEKLLSKPPFCYLHDIFSEVIRTTGFMKGLYGENELKSDNVKDRDSKVAFLQKAIDVVMLVSGEPLTVKPQRIVAGSEPDKTNELLQVLAKCCLSKMSSDDAVRRVLAGEKLDIQTKASTSGSQDKENKEGRERQLDKEERMIQEHSRSRDQKRHKSKDQESQQQDGEKDHHQDREHSEKNHLKEQDHSRDRVKDKSRDRELDKDKGRVKERDKERLRDREKEKDKGRDKANEKTGSGHSNRDRHRERDKEKRRDKEQERDPERHKEVEDKSKSLKNSNSKVTISEKPQQTPSTDESVVKAKPMPEPAEAADNQSDSPARIPRPSSAKGQRQRPKIEGQDESDSEGDRDAHVAQRSVTLENGDAGGYSVPSNMASSRMYTPRPGSARPAPPRVKKQESNIDSVPAERLASGKSSAQVIVDGKKISDHEEDDDQFLVKESLAPYSDINTTLEEPVQELIDEEKHGGLVKKLLETKKDYEASPSARKSKEKNVASEAAQKTVRDMVTREIERTRSFIQTVCRSTLPQGKIIDYIQEDMDAMQAEFNTWRQENKEHARALLEEQRATDLVVEPLKAELAELEQLIKEEQDKICAVKSNIMKNEEKIQKLVTGISLSSKT